MTQIRVQRLAARGDEEYRIKHEVARHSVVQKKPDRIPRVDCKQHLGCLKDAVNSEQGEHGKPDQRDRAEDGANPGGSMALHAEQQDQDEHGNRNDIALQGGCGKLQAFHRAQHRDRRRDHRSAVQHGGAEQSEQDQNSRAKVPPSPRLSARST